MIFILGVVSIMLVYFFQNMTNTDEHNYVLLKEATEGAMIDALDLASYRDTGTVRIDQEKFVENFIRRFAQSSQLSRTYYVRIHDVNEEPPKVTISISSDVDTNALEEYYEFNIKNKLSAIIEVPRDGVPDTDVDPLQVP
jgi:hypothetical protein